MTRLAYDARFFAACLHALTLDAWNAATEPLRAWVARVDERAASALGGGDESAFPGDWPHRNACACDFCYSAAMGGGR